MPAHFDIRKNKTKFSKSHSSGIFGQLLLFFFLSELDFIYIMKLRNICDIFIVDKQHKQEFFVTVLL